MGRSRLRRHTASTNTKWGATPALLLAGAVAVGGGAWTVTQIELAARGDGHGRGLGQNGAYDYAKQGWTAEEILLHYYEGTTLGTLPESKIAVRLQGRDDKTLDVYSDVGATVAGQSLGPGEAAHLTPTPGGANVTITTGCNGAVVWEGTTDNPWVDPVDAGPGRPADEHLMLCDDNRSYRGALGVALEGNAFRTVNYLDIEDYLLGVVPLEMQPGWADQGGAEALRAQAVAARSYSASEGRYDYAQTCDTTSCQMYGGSDVEDQRTTEAVQSTAGAVLMDAGEIVHAEYSASSDRDGMAENALAKAPPTVPGADPAPEDFPQLTLDEAEAPLLVQPETAAATTIPQDGTAPRTGESLIDAKYREIGGTNSDIGAPLGPEMRMPGGGGTFRTFAAGVIVDTPRLGVQVLDLSAFQQLLLGG